MPEGNPRVGEKIWVEERKENGLQTNGTIIQVRRWDREVVARFSDDYADSFDFDDLYGKWTDKFGGSWMLYKNM